MPTDGTPCFWGVLNRGVTGGIRVFLPSQAEQKNEQMSPNKCHIELSSCPTSKVHSKLSFGSSARKDLACLKAVQMTTDGAPCFWGVLNRGVTGGIPVFCQAASKKNEQMSPSKCHIELSSCPTSKVHSNLSLRPPVRKDLTCLNAVQNDDGWYALFLGRSESRFDWRIRVFLPSRVKTNTSRCPPANATYS